MFGQKVSATDTWMQVITTLESSLLMGIDVCGYHGLPLPMDLCPFEYIFLNILLQQLN